MNPIEFVPLAPLMATLAVMLSLSVMVERFLMIAGWLIDRLQLARTSLEWNRVAELRLTLNLRRRATEESQHLLQPADNDSGNPQEIPPNPDYAEPESDFDIQPYEPGDLRPVVKEFWLQLFGVLVAVAGCYYSHFSAWTLVIWLKQWAAGQAATVEPAGFGGILFTGVLIGAGSKPVHFLMNYLVNRKLVLLREEARRVRVAPEPTAPPAEPSLAAPPTIVPPLSLPDIESLVGFRYDGGIHAEALEHTHIRSKPVRRIVYHHTALHAEAPFAEVVREFDRQGWLAGYHCVVLRDASIHVQCRWDRFGNHVRGYNETSMGLALQGNFETSPAVPYANIDGRFGPPEPASSQLDAAARIVALWVLAFALDLDFGSVIVPHKALSVTACPGNRFPHAAFQDGVRGYVEQWRGDDRFMQALERFVLRTGLKG